MTVRFLDGVRLLEEQGVTTLLELGPDGTLSSLARDCLRGVDAVSVPLLRGRTEPEEVVAALATLQVRGVPMHWERLATEEGARRVPLPTYPFQRRRHWLPDPVAQDSVPAPGRAAGQRSRPVNELAPSAHAPRGDRTMRETVRAAVALVLGHDSPDDIPRTRRSGSWGSAP
ncbi:hypothetical protein SAZ11_46840 [Streptomyces sp. FXJ1.4098]|nr:hypothetical protein [Streptomyces sp. FXJ1.4098]